MQKKLTLSVDAETYDRLHAVIGRGSISRFIEDLVKPHLFTHNLMDAYRHMAADREREAEADAWVEGTIGHSNREAW